MAYEKSAVDKASKKGVFGNKVFDPKALTMDDREKKQLHDKLTKTQGSMSDDLPMDSGNYSRPLRDNEKPEVQIELSFLESILLFLMNLFGFGNAKDFKANKAVRIIEKELNKIKPPVYSGATKRITKVFAYKIHDLYLKLIIIKKIFDRTFDNRAHWNNPDMLEKTGIEIMFERMTGINSLEIDDAFSVQGINKTIMKFETIALAVDNIEKSLYSYLYGIDKELVEPLNKIYTNLVYFKRLTDYDFLPFFRRFDPQFNPGASPYFIDISGEAITSYLIPLEEALLQVDLSMDNTAIFKKLNDIANYMKEAYQTPSNETESAPEELIEKDLNSVFDVIKDLLYRNYITLLTQVIKKDPHYIPSFIHTKFDLYKTYCDTMEKRVKNIIRISVRDKKRKKIEEMIGKIFETVKFVGIYNVSLSEKLEESGYPGFSYNYQIAVVNTFLTLYYEEIVKNILNIVMMSGVFIEKILQKNISETFYGMEKFQEKFREFISDMNPDGSVGRKMIEQLSKKDANLLDNKKSVERNIAAVNSKAQDIYEEFYNYFVIMTDIISKLFDDIEAKPPKNLRNIRSIGGLKNVKILNYIERSYKALASIKEAITLLKD